VQGAALDKGFATEHLAPRRGQRLGAVEDYQQPVVEGQAAGHEVGQQGAHHGPVLGGAVPQPDRLLGTVGGDRQGDHHAPLGHVLPIQHETLMSSLARSRAINSASAV
jgi:hypothetical protein